MLRGREARHIAYARCESRCEELAYARDLHEFLIGIHFAVELCYAVIEPVDLKFEHLEFIELNTYFEK